jgi:hypothetical protein
MIVHMVRRLSETPKVFPKKISKNITSAIAGPAMYQGHGSVIKVGMKIYIVRVEKRVNFKWFSKTKKEIFEFSR